MVLNPVERGTRFLENGAAYDGISSGIAHIVDAILHDQRSIMTVCSRTEDIAEVSDSTGPVFYSQ